MKTRIILLIFSFITSAILCSCDKEDKEKKENQVTAKVVSNTFGVPVRVSGFGETELIIKDKWEKKIYTKDWSIRLEAQCDTPTVLLTVEIYVNGKLRDKGEGNKHAVAYVKLK